MSWYLLIGLIGATSSMIQHFIFISSLIKKFNLRMNKDKKFFYSAFFTLPLVILVTMVFLWPLVLTKFCYRVYKIYRLKSNANSAVPSTKI
jgi:hypothetical protein